MKFKLRKYIRQLTVLSRLRKLQKETIKEIEKMPITYDIKKDYWYQEGKQEEKREMIIDDVKRFFYKP